MRYPGYRIRSLGVLAKAPRGSLCANRMATKVSHASLFPLAELQLSTGLRRCLEAEGIATAGDLCVRDAEELLGLRNLGKGRLQELRKRLRAFGVQLMGE